MKNFLTEKGDKYLGYPLKAVKAFYKSDQEKKLQYFEPSNVFKNISKEDLQYLDFVPMGMTEEEVKSEIERRKKVATVKPMISKDYQKEFKKFGHEPMIYFETKPIKMSDWDKMSFEERFNVFKEEPYSYEEKIESLECQEEWQNMTKAERDEWRKKLKDTDGDRVPDEFDCNKNNVMEQKDFNWRIKAMRNQGWNEDKIEDWFITIFKLSKNEFEKHKNTKTITKEYIQKARMLFL